MSKRIDRFLRTFSRDNHELEEAIEEISPPETACPCAESEVCEAIRTAQHALPEIEALHAFARVMMREGPALDDIWFAKRGVDLDRIRELVGE